MMKLEHESPSAGHWSRQQYESLFAETPETSQRLILVVDEHPESNTKHSSQVVSHLIAFLVAHRVDNEWELENIVVSEDSRRRGVGKKLLSQFIDHARLHNATAVFLEVRESNQPARALYRSLGFLEIGARKDYYPNPPEDAILCRLSFN
jgi:ribosomal-protein-alanine acetyltransferase